jgi:hypothetical protein
MSKANKNKGRPDKPKAGTKKESGRPYKDQRDSKGRFKPGNKIAVGHNRQYATVKEALKKAFINSFCEQDIIDIVNQIKRRARRGNLFAIKEILDRLLGKPTQPLTGDFDEPIKVQIVLFKDKKNEHCNSSK